ncbi:MAG: tyrosine-type recombinase/integrase [Paludibacter sp.]|nr:tyrosine-type recombinase/integrase [Paludibacter sp.]
MVNEFLQYLQYEKNYSFHTVLSYRTDLYQFCDFLVIKPQEINTLNVNSQQIQQWTLLLISTKISARSLSRKISTLKSFWKFLLVRGLATQDPTLKIILPKTKKPIPAFFKEKEMNSALDNKSNPNDFETTRDLLIISIFYQTGIRLAELISIEDKDIDLINGNLRVTGKRNKQRIIPISNSLCKEISEYIELRNNKLEILSANLFLRENGQKLYPKLIYNIVHNTMSEVSSLHKRSPHVLRHTFATSILNGGADINAVKDLLGHSSLAATQVYTHTSFEELNNIYKHAHPRAK